MAGPRRGSVMVPMGEEPATLALILEALRGLDERIQSQNLAAVKDREMLHDMHIRVVQIESNQLQRKVDDLMQKVDDLESERDRRVGMVSAAEWTTKVGPWLATIIAALAAIFAWAAGKH